MPSATPAGPSKRERAVASYRAGQSAEHRGDAQAASTAYLGGEYADPSYIQNFQALIALYLREKNLAGADIQLHQLIAFHPQEKNAHFMLGEVQRAEHLDRLAIDSYGAELRINPGFKPAIDARDALLKNATAGAGSSLAESARAYLLAVTQDFAFALPLPDATGFDDPLALVPAPDASALAQTLLANGSAALQRGQLEVAFESFDAAAKTDPADWRAAFFAGLTARMQGNKKAARDRFFEASNRARRPEPIAELALIQLDEGDAQSAFATARRAYELDPNNAPAAFIAGMLAVIVADNATAERDLSQTLNLGAPPPKTAYFLDAVRRAPN